MDDYSWGGMTLTYLYHCLSEVSLPNGKGLGGSTTLLMGWFLVHFPYFFSVDDNPKYLSNYLITVKWEIQRGQGEGKTYRALLDRFEMDDVCWSCTKNTGRFRSLWRYFGIQVGSCAVFRRYIDTCLSELNGCTDTCRTSLDLQQMFLLQAFIDFRPHTIKDDSWGEPTEDMSWRFEDGYMLCYERVSHHQIFPSILGSPRGQQMRSRSLHTSSSTRREARLIPMIWLMALLAMLMSTWVKRG